MEFPSPNYFEIETNHKVTGWVGNGPGRGPQMINISTARDSLQHGSHASKLSSFLSPNPPRLGFIGRAGRISSEA